MAPKAKTSQTKTDVKVEKKDVKADAEVKAGGAPPKPNKEAYEKRINDVEAEITAKKEEIDGVIAKIEKGSHGKDVYEEKRQALFEQLKNVKTQKGGVIEQRMELISASQRDKREARDAKNKLRDMEKEGKALNEESLDNSIASLEYKLEIGTLSLKEEKSILMQIKKLKAQRPQAIKLTKELEVLKAGAAAGEGSSAPSLSREENIKSLNERLDQLKSEAQQISDSLDKLKEGRDKQLGNVKPLIAARQKLRDDVSELISKKKEIVDERKKAFDSWREHENKVWEQKKAKEEEAWDLWRKEQAAQKAQQELEAPNPYIEETLLLEQTLDYCRSQLPKSNSGEGKEEKEVEFNNPEGYMVMKTKKERDAEMYFEATKGKRGKKGIQKTLDPNEKKEVAEESSSKGKKIKHTAETFAIFKTLNLTTPMTTADLAPLLEQLEGKLSKVQEKTRKWETERKNKVQAAKDAAEARTSSGAGGEGEDKTAEA